MKIYVDTKIGAILKGKLKTQFSTIFQDSSAIVEREYKSETPVDRGDMRRDVKTFKTGLLSYKVTTTSLSDKGAPYPIYLHSGTGKFRGARDMGYTTGRVRAKNFYGFGNRKAMTGFFAGLYKRGVKFSIPPNKFASRATGKAEPKVVQFISKEISKLIKQ